MRPCRKKSVHPLLKIADDRNESYKSAKNSNQNLFYKYFPDIKEIIYSSLIKSIVIKLIIQIIFKWNLLYFAHRYIIVI